MKNRRDVCLAKDAGFIQYPGLPGRIKTGCMATPAFKSRYCTQHTVRVGSTSENDTAQDKPHDSSPPLLESKQLLRCCLRRRSQEVPHTTRYM